MDELKRYTNTFITEIYGNRVTQINTFQNEVPYQKRCEDSIRLCVKYPDYIPVIVNVNGTEIKLRKKKYLVPKDILASGFTAVIRSNVNLDKSQAMFLFCDDVLFCNMKFMGELYDSYKIRNNIKKDDDQYFYLTLCSENTFG